MKTVGTTLRHSIQLSINTPNLSWEPTENFHDCERLLNSFWMEVGEYRKEKTREGIEVIPGKQWIGAYLLRFLQSYTTQLITHTREGEGVLQGNPGSRGESSPRIRPE